MLAITRVKKDMEFNQNFRSLLEVLKSIAVSQFHLLEKRFKKFKKFDEVIEVFFRSFNPQAMEHPFLNPGNRPLGIVAVTSDQGLLGGLNRRVVGTAVERMQSAKDELIVVGERGQHYARELRDSFAAFPGIRDDEREAQAVALRNYLFQKAKSGAFGTIQVVYPRALSLVNQRVEMVTLLPYSPPSSGETPEETSEEEAEEMPSSVSPSTVILESSPAKILEYLVFLLLAQRLKEIFALSRLAELGARYMHLEESAQKIQELNQKLKLRYFRLRHEKIDQNMRELFSARMIYAG